MLSSRAKRVLAVTLAAAFTLMAISPFFVSAATVPGSAKSGPYVDKLVFKVITGPDQQVLALLNNEIDLIGDMVDPQFLPSLQAADNVEVANVLRNGYGYLVIKTNKYPLNITNFRRALAFALDKDAISDEVWAGLSSPQDSCVPQVNPFSCEGLLTYTYYEANVALGNLLLDQAGFFDVDNDTNHWREAPNGAAFDINVECATSSPIAIEVGSRAAATLRALHVNAISTPTDFYEYLDRLYFHGDFDIVFLGSSFTTFDVDWLAYEFWSDYANEPYWNFPCWRNSTYDSWRNQLLHSTNYTEVYEAAIEMQKIWVHSCPQIICYENILLSAYRTDKFEGYINDVSGGVPDWWTNYKVHLKASMGGPFGGVFRWSNPLDINTFNFMTTSSAYSRNILDQLYDSMMIQDDKGKDVMWLAESYTASTHADDSSVPEGHTRFTFDIIQNATWSDGMPITAEDVAYSLNYFREAPGNMYGVDLTEMTAAYAKSTYQVVVEFSTESYWHLHTVAYKPVIPKHFFVTIGVSGWNTWNPQPPTEAMVTSGPFNVSSYVRGDFCEMTYNPDYFYGVNRATVTTTTPPVATGPDFTMAIVAGAVGAAVVILVGGYVLMRQK